MRSPFYAVLVCTRNRPDDLARSLASIAAQEGPSERLVLVVDASSVDVRVRNAETARTTGARHLVYPGRPSLTRQRNFGVDTLPENVELVHFLDDDVELQPGYFQHLNAVFATPSTGGAGGRVVEPGRSEVGRPVGSAVQRLFLLGSRVPGRVLCSGATTAAQGRPLTQRTHVAWLGGCSCYRRALLERHRFDETLEGYALDEDLDLSYRVGQEAALVVDPSAVLIHHASPQNRADVRRFARDTLVHRYWFLEKNLHHPLRKLAFWWSVLGRVLAAAASRHPDARAVLRGRLEGTWAVWHRAHPLLQATPAEEVATGKSALRKKTAPPPPRAGPPRRSSPGGAAG